MEYSIEFTKTQKQNKLEIAKINYIRIFKKALLPCELVGMNGYEITECFCNINTKSCLKWRLPQPNITKPRGKNILNRWKIFLQWLRTQLVYQVYDFKNWTESIYSISSCRQFFKISKPDQKIKILEKLNHQENKYR